MKLIDQINHLRLSAAFLFDLGRSRKQTPDQIAANISPLAQKLDEQIMNAPVGELVIALKSIEHQMEAHQLDMRFFAEKIEDCKSHVENIKKSLVKKLIDQDKTCLIEDGHTLTLIDDNLNIR